MSKDTHGNMQNKKKQFKIIVETDISKEDLKHKIEQNGFKIIFLENIKEIRTQQQSRALHLFFSQVSQEFNDKHITVKDFLGGSFALSTIELEFTPERVKEIWRRIQKGALNQDSTTELNKNRDIDFCYDALNLYVSERYGGECQLPPFPSSDFFLREPE